MTVIIQNIQNKQYYVFFPQKGAYTFLKNAVSIQVEAYLVFVYIWKKSEGVYLRDH